MTYVDTIREAATRAYNRLPSRSYEAQHARAAFDSAYNRWLDRPIEDPPLCRCGRDYGTFGIQQLCRDCYDEAVL